MKRIPKRLSLLLAIVTVLSVVFSVSVAPASAYEIKGKTVCEVLGMDGEIYYKWLKSHEKDHYYLGTPYGGYDHRNPNGDCQGAYGSLDRPGVPALNCMGFVWHALYKPTKMSGGYTSKIPAYGKAGGWYGLYTYNNVSRRTFSSKKELLASGYAEQGDIIWMFVYNEHVSNDNNHICIYWGDGHSDKVWHSVGKGCVFGKLRDYNQYIVLKVGAIRKLDTPVIKSVVNTASGPKITWKKVSGATNYRVFVKNGNKWKTLGDTHGTSFYDKTAVSGKNYTYTVRCIGNDGKAISGYNKKGISNTYIGVPTGQMAEATDKGITFSWKAVDGAAQYRVYRRIAGKDWTVVKRTAKTSVTDTKAKQGVTYEYTVRSLNSSGKTVSEYRTPVKAYRLSGIPKISGATVNNKGLTLSWNKVKGAEQYRVFKRENGSWSTIGYTAAESFTVKSPAKNAYTTYYVRCVTDTHKAFTSVYNGVGYTALYEAAPKLSSILPAENGINLTWNAQKNAGKYVIFRKESGGDWTKLAKTTATSYTDTTVKTGSTYAYTLRITTEDGKTFVSGFNSTGWSISYVKAPDFTVETSAKGITLSWNSVKNAAMYRVFLKDGNTWKALGDTKSTSYAFKSVTNGETYTFAVRCLDEKNRYSSFYKTKSVTYIDPNAPTEATQATETDNAE